MRERLCMLSKRRQEPQQREASRFLLCTSLIISQFIMASNQLLLLRATPPPRGDIRHYNHPSVVSFIIPLTARRTQLSAYMSKIFTLRAHDADIKQCCCHKLIHYRIFRENNDLSDSTWSHKSQTTWICCWWSHNSAASGVLLVLFLIFNWYGPPAESAHSWSHGCRRCNQWDQEEDTYIQSEQSQHYHHPLCINECWITSLFCFPVQLGANGYTFAIDPNGYVLLHPNLRPKVCPTTNPNSAASNELST